MDSLLIILDDDIKDTLVMSTNYCIALIKEDFKRSSDAVETNGAEFKSLDYNIIQERWE